MHIIYIYIIYVYGRRRITHEVAQAVAAQRSTARSDGPPALEATASDTSSWMAGQPLRLQVHQHSTVLSRVLHSHLIVQALVLSSYCGILCS